MSSQPVSVVFGGSSIGNRDPFITQADLEDLFKVLKKHDVKIIDSAQLYGKSEAKLGESKAGHGFTIDTKWPGGAPAGWATRENVVNSAIESVKKLDIPQVFYFILFFFMSR